jgi:8-oxo-dGTP pyrophosphatase MutT (NUDIX family)
MNVKRVSREERVEFPGGRNIASDNENSEKTLRREILQETGLRIQVDANLHLFWTVRGDEEKYAYLVWWEDCSGALRIDHPIKDGETTLLGLPYWEDLEELKASSVLFRRHQNLLSKLEEILPMPR